MKHKITFVRPRSRHLPGATPRCSTKKWGVSCIKREDHAGPHRFAGRKAVPPRDARVSSRKKKEIPHIVRLDCLQMIEDPIYRARLLDDLRVRELRPAVECMLWYYAKGKPKEMVEHSGTLSLQEELSTLTTEELRVRALDIAAMLSGTQKTVH